MKELARSALNGPALPVIATWLLVAGSGLYLTGVCPVSPVYFAFIGGAALVSLKLLRSNLSVPVRALEPLIFIFALVSYLLMTQGFLDHVWRVLFVNLLFSFSIFPMVVLAGSELSVERLERIGVHAIRASLLVLSLEGGWRLSHPDYEKALYYGSPPFYAFKFSSIMFYDSNPVAFMALVVLCFTFYLAGRGRKLTLEALVGIIVLLGTLSRAAILVGAALGIALLIGKWWKKKAAPMKFGSEFFGLIGGGAILVVAWLSYRLWYDPSLRTKFFLLEGLYRYINAETLSSLLVGKGVGSFPELPGTEYAGHNLLVMWVTERGFLGGGLEIMFWWALLVSTRYRASYLLLPAFVAGMSLWPHAIPFLYAFLGLMVLLESGRERPIALL